MKKEYSNSPLAFYRDCFVCKKPFSWNDCIAAYTADEKNKTICIKCQLKNIKEETINPRISFKGQINEQ